MGGVGSFGAGDHSPGPPSTSGMMLHGSKIRGKNMEIGSTETRSFGHSRSNDGGNMTGGFPSTSWDDSALLSDNFLKDFAEDDRKTISNLNTSQNQVGNYLHNLLCSHMFTICFNHESC